MFRQTRVPLVYVLVATISVAVSTIALNSPSPVTFVLAIVAAGGLGAMFLASSPVFCATVTIIYVSTQGLAEASTAITLLGMNINGAQVFGVLFTGLLVLRLFHHALQIEGGAIAPHLVLPMFGVLSVAVLAFFRSEDTSVAAAALFRIVSSLVVLLFAFVTTRHARDLRVYLYTAVLSSVVVSLAAVYEIVSSRGGADILRGGALRAEGSIGTSTTGVICFVGFATCVYLLDDRQSRHRTLNVLALGVIGFGLFASFVRAALLGAALFLAWTTLAGQFRKHGLVSRRRSLVIATVGILALAIGLLIVDDATLTSRLHDVPLIGAMDQDDPAAGSGRIRIWTSVLKSLRDNSLLDWIGGHGMFATMDATQRYIFTRLTAHNSVLSLLYDQGVVGLLVYALFMYTLLHGLAFASQTPGSAQATAGFALRLLVCFLFTIDMFGSTIYLLAERWTLFLIIGAVLGLAYRESAAKNTTVSAGASTPD